MVYETPAGAALRKFRIPNHLSELHPRAEGKHVIAFVRVGEEGAQADLITGVDGKEEDIHAGPDIGAEGEIPEVVPVECVTESVPGVLADDGTCARQSMRLRNDSRSRRRP